MVDTRLSLSPPTESLGTRLAVILLHKLMSIRCFVIVVLQNQTLILNARLWFHKIDMGLASCMEKM